MLPRCLDLYDKIKITITPKNQNKHLKLYFIKFFFLQKIKILLFFIILSRQQLDVVREQTWDSFTIPEGQTKLGCTLLLLYALLPSAPLLFYTPILYQYLLHYRQRTFDVNKLTKIPSPYENNWFFKDSGAKLKNLVLSWHFSHRS